WPRVLARLPGWSIVTRPIWPGSTSSFKAEVMALPFAAGAGAYRECIRRASWRQALTGRAPAHPDAPRPALARAPPPRSPHSRRRPPRLRLRPAPSARPGRLVAPPIPVRRAVLPLAVAAWHRVELRRQRLPVDDQATAQRLVLLLPHHQQLQARMIDVRQVLE